MPDIVHHRIRVIPGWDSLPEIAAALIEGDAARTLELTAQIAALPGRLIQIQARRSDQPTYRADLLIDEQVISVNTTAAGGNASLMTLG